MLPKLQFLAEYPSSTVHSRLLLTIVNIVVINKCQHNINYFLVCCHLLIAKIGNLV